MIKLLTPEEKKLLRTASRYMMANGLDNGNIELDVDYEVDSSTFNRKYVTHFSNNYNIEIFPGVAEILEKIFNYCLKNDMFLDFSDRDINYQRLEFDINAEDQEISMSQYINTIERGDGEGHEFFSEDDEALKNCIEEIIEEYKKAGKKVPDSLQLDYSGGGDSGYIEGNFTNGFSVPSSVEDWAYGRLEDNFGGWEINEGSQGEFYFNLKNKSCELIHYSNYEEFQNDTIFEESFGN
jgi:hypothetical protein